MLCYALQHGSPFIAIATGVGNACTTVNQSTWAARLHLTARPEPLLSFVAEHVIGTSRAPLFRTGALWVADIGVSRCATITKNNK